MTIISNDIIKAKQLLEQEEVVSIPTETVYGLAGNIYSEKAIRSIFRIKQRPLFNPLIVHIPSIEDLDRIVEYVPEKAQRLAKTFWPGPLTLVLKKKDTVPDLITAGKDTVAVRVPHHPLTLKLLDQLDFPLAAPSANPFNRISPTKASHVEAYFKGELKMVLDGGACKRGIESTIIGFENDQPIIYRLGSTPIEAIEAVVGHIKIENKTVNSPKAPGMLARHYAPKTKTILTSNILEAIEANKSLRLGILLFNNLDLSGSIDHVSMLSETQNMKEAASNLYAALHDMDSKDLDLIIVEQLPNHGLGKSINDRLRRATTK